MKGLLLKDWFVIWKQCRYLLFVPAVFLAVSALSDDSQFFAIFAFLLSAMYPMTVMGLDEQSKWERYALTMPFRRRDLVLSKYLLSFCSLFLYGVLYLLLVLLFKHDPEAMKVSVMLTSVGISIGILYSALAYPFLFKLGMEKGRIWYLILIAVVCGNGAALAAMLGDEISLNLLLTWLDCLLLILPLAALSLFGLSAFLSIKLYESREF